MRRHFRFSFHGRKWNEEWLKVYIDELDSRKMTPDEKASLKTLIARDAESVKAESRKIKRVLDLKNVGTVANAISMGLKVEQCSKLANVSVDFVLSVQRQFSTN